MEAMTLTKNTGKTSSDKRIFALCQKCGKHIYECADYMETENQGVLFRLKCPYCGWEFSHQILIKLPSCNKPTKQDMNEIIDTVMEKMGMKKKFDANDYRVR